MAEEALAAFLAGQIDPAAFGHAEHVRMAFALLERSRGRRRCSAAR
jgi:hypothetical protein